LCLQSPSSLAVSRGQLWTVASLGVHAWKMYNVPTSVCGQALSPRSAAHCLVLRHTAFAAFASFGFAFAATAATAISGSAVGMHRNLSTCMPCIFLVHPPYCALDREGIPIDVGTPVLGSSAHAGGCGLQHTASQSPRACRRCGNHHRLCRALKHHTCNRFPWSQSSPHHNLDTPSPHQKQSIASKAHSLLQIALHPWLTFL
jgi:hypothetical protein